MGERISCFDVNRLSTVQETQNNNKSYTESEITEFVASTNYLSSHEVKKKRKLKIINFSKICNEKTNINQRCVDVKIFSPSPARSPEPKTPHFPNRIFSSNASVSSVNLIEKVHCDVSKSPIRAYSFKSVSPVPKYKGTHGYKGNKSPDIVKNIASKRKSAEPIRPKNFKPK